MRFKEFIGAVDAPLDEETLRQIYAEILPLLIVEEDGGGEGGGGFDSGPPPTVPDGETEPAPTVPPPIRGPGVWRPGGGFNGNMWFNQLYNTLKIWAVSDRISKRLKQLGVKGIGVQRIQMAKKVAAKHVKLLLNNPGATAYKIPVWTTKAPPKPVIKIWNEEFAKAFAMELGLLNEEAVIEAAQRTAAAYMDVDFDDLEIVGRGLDTEVVESGKILKRKVINAANASWHVLLYTHRTKNYVRIEGPDGNTMYRAQTKKRTA